MKHWTLTILFAFFLVTVQADRYIIKFNEQTGQGQQVQKLAPLVQTSVLKQYQTSFHGVLVDLPEDFDLDSLTENPAVESVIKDKVYALIKPVKRKTGPFSTLSIESVPTGMLRIGLTHDELENGEEIDATIAIIDTGIDMENSSLNVIGGKNFVEPHKTPQDGEGHGTHVAGIAAARNDGHGVVGVAPGAKLIALKVLDDYGYGYFSDIIDAVDWVTEHADEVDVVNMSLGGWGYEELFHQAIQKSIEKGVVYVVAAGNESDDISWTEPASYPEVLTVSAMADTDGIPGGYGKYTTWGDPDDTLAWFSNYSRYIPENNPVNSPGAGIDVAAPGVDIRSTYPGNGTAVMSGTSMASPHVAGTVARLLAGKSREGRDARHVYAVRQSIIDAAEPQDEWNAVYDTFDPDPNHEGLLRVDLIQ